MTNEEAIKWLEAIREKYIHGGDEGFDEKRNEALDLAIAALSRDRWISVEERLPVYGDKCLVAFKLNGHNDWSIQVSYCYVQKEGFWSDCGRDYKAVAWMPLPEPQKEDKP